MLARNGSGGFRLPEESYRDAREDASALPQSEGGARGSRPAPWMIKRKTQGET
jgi:hypothetical protein